MLSPASALLPPPKTSFFGRPLLCIPLHLVTCRRCRSTSSGGSNVIFDTEKWFNKSKLQSSHPSLPCVVECRENVNQVHATLAFNACLLLFWQ